jgi:hypothetical protein
MDCLHCQQLPSKAMAVVYVLIQHLLGPDERYRRLGVPLAVRPLAERIGCTPKCIQAAMRVLLEQRIVVRNPDPDRRNAYRYQLVHPEFWREAERLPPRPFRQLEPDYLEEWSKPLSRFAPKTQPNLMDNFWSGVPPAGYTHACDPLKAKKEIPLSEAKNNYPKSSNFKKEGLITLYVYHDTQRIPLVDAVAAAMNRLMPGWDACGVIKEHWLSAELVGKLQEDISRHYDCEKPWAATWLRRAVRQASEAAELRRADQVETRRQEEFAQQKRIQEYARRLLSDWEQLQKDAYEVFPALKEFTAYSRMKAGKLVRVEKEQRAIWEALSLEEQEDWLTFMEAYQAMKRVKGRNLLELELAWVWAEKVREWLQWRLSEKRSQEQVKTDQEEPVESSDARKSLSSEQEGLQEEPPPESLGQVIRESPKSLKKKLQQVCSLSLPPGSLRPGHYRQWWQDVQDSQVLTRFQHKVEAFLQQIESHEQAQTLLQEARGVLASLQPCEAVVGLLRGLEEPEQINSEEAQPESGRDPPLIAFQTIASSSPTR